MYKYYFKILILHIFFCSFTSSIFSMFFSQPADSLCRSLNIVLDESGQTELHKLIISESWSVLYNKFLEFPIEMFVIEDNQGKIPLEYVELGLIKETFDFVDQNSSRFKRDQVRFLIKLSEIDIKKFITFCMFFSVKMCLLKYCENFYLLSRFYKRHSVCSWPFNYCSLSKMVKKYSDGSLEIIK